MEQVKKTALELKQYLEAQHTDTVGFATLDDMSFLVSELRECKGGTYD